MMISFLSPRETIQWFEDVDRQLEIICFMISAEPKHRLTLNNIAQNYIDADVALGTKVAFILFGEPENQEFTGVDTEYAGRCFLPGVKLQPNTLRAHVNEVKVDNYTFDTLTDTTVSAAIAWMEMFGIQRSSLPALCVLVKGSAPVVIHLGGQFNESIVLKIFGRLADIAERDVGKAVSASFELETRLKKILTVTEKTESLEKSFLKNMETMCQKYAACNEERNIIAEFIATKHYSIVNFENTLNKCTFSSVNGFNESSTVKGVRNKLTKLISAREDLDFHLNQKNEILSLSESVKSINQRRQETLQLVKELLHEGVESKVVERESLWLVFDKYIARVNQIVSLVEKGGNLFDFIKLS